MKTKSLKWSCMLLLLVGCVSPHVVTEPKANVDFRQYRTGKLVLADSVQSGCSKEGLPMLEGLLSGKLQSLGYQVVAADPKLTLAVNVTAFSFGDRATRVVGGVCAGA